MLQVGVWHDRAVTSPWNLLVLASMPTDRLRELFAQLPVEVVVPSVRTPAGVIEAAAEAQIVVGGWGPELPITAEVVEAAPRLAFVHQPSAGLDTVDVAACTARGIPVSNTGGSNSISVAEWCVGATFAALRSLAFADHAIREHRWPQFEVIGRSAELAGRRVGIIGMGHIGRACAVRYAALGCDVAHWSRSQRAAAEAGGAPWLPLEDLLRRSDVLVVVVALTPQTQGLLDAERLALLPPGAMIINASRGGLVDEPALLAAIEAGALAGGALDVFATEPLPAESPLLQEDRLILTPHIAGGTQQSMAALIEHITANVRRAVSGEPVLDVVNHDALEDQSGVIRRREA
jgi:phosphoglycerate dehydrogenase-like enzyme